MWRLVRVAATHSCAAGRHVRTACAAAFYLSNRRALTPWVMPSSVRALALAVMVVAATALFVLVLRCSDSVEATLAAQQAQRAAPAALPLPLPLPLTTGRDGLPRLNTSQRVPGSVRLVLLSDTHTHHSELDVPDGDILIHAGDYALARDSAGRVREKKRFDEW